MSSWKLENDVNDWVKDQFSSIRLEKNKDYNEESAMSEFMKESLKGSAKTKNKTNFGKPDFHIEKYEIPVVIENKLGIKKMLASNKGGVKFDDKSIGGYAVNGALYYARNMIASNKYSEVIAIGCAGDDKSNVAIQVYFVFGHSEQAFKKLEQVTTFDFLESKESFQAFYKNAKLTEEEKHRILIDSRAALKSYAKKLNKLMHNHNITAPQRVLYVSGMLLAMQDLKDENGEIIQAGLTTDDLQGSKTNNTRDGALVVDRIEEYLKAKGIDENKRKLMLASFSEISKDEQRDHPTETDKEVAKFINGKASVTKQIFTFIYEYIYQSIDGMAGHIDIMGEMYSEFLKYALGDGKEIGIVLTPPYVTKMMAQILNIDKDSRVLDLATGSAGFLISAMELMIEQTEKAYGKNTSKANEQIKKIKSEQLLGIELNAEMYTLATTNMILRGDGSSKIEKGSAFNRPESLFTDFKADRILLNPPFSFEENGMPFIAYGLNKLEKGGLGAIIIQDSAGSGKAIASNQAILKKHTLLASIKMPTDLFQPMAGVQTSIYIFEAGKPHDIESVVKFIDFRNDGYKRTERSLLEQDNPSQRYQDIIKIYKAGRSAKVSKELWDLENTYIEDFISKDGNDWNFEQHQKINTTPTLEDFKKTVSDYLAWEVSNILKNQKEDALLGKQNPT
ncbi:HsdM family class I SAM-dependent methyltransferase [Avibacterium paragallinarum]|uniref:site-specific DNA-methyltransferase (adenine-specific) n=1 Tax=Avibacterium paragallinarum TaxID=728 RepID=A0AAE5WH67_AVIPA|nr:N-6 DNA methylase [Avibacterium paragallinarum]MEE3608745.1 N-6 DNA methylase [Avibacterium paragallinarum]MEE3620204.1 N-6 DNA methylase [Avibacterium paragallinarum]MEE3668113.1 N-6 DNA methylase [Avibacterium paragallinarum]MEE3681033.1 N-6 DNA methylase [Avibacterium paragallinarum]MEE4385870.1 N-6 DNA methylase [Avibacterium paragallinarum]